MCPALHALFSLRAAFNIGPSKFVPTCVRSTAAMQAADAGEAGAVNVTGVLNAGLANSVEAEGLALQPGRMYYPQVTATNMAGLATTLAGPPIRVSLAT